MRTLLGLLAASLLLPACAATTTIEPVGADSLRWHAGIGGPIVAAFDTYIPMPNPAVGMTYGLDSDLEATGTLHLLGLPYGIISADLGAVYYPIVDAEAATLGIHPRLLVMASLKSGVDARFRAWPAVTGTAMWRVGPNRIYGGADLLVPLSQPDYDPDPPPVILSPFIGYRWRLGDKVNLFAELKWHGLNVVTDATADYANPGGHGAISPFIAFDFSW
jgi:hypothetical protein